MIIIFRLTISKGIIESIPAPGDNVFEVRIPLLEDNTKNKMIFKATCCTPPGYTSGYNKGDIVFVTFENEEPDMAIILGKLYTVPKDEQKKTNLENFSKNNSVIGKTSENQSLASSIDAGALVVENIAALPKNTIIGDVSFSKIEELMKKVEYLEQKINEFSR